MTRNPYFRFLRSWFWLIGLGIIVAAIATHLALDDRQSLYETTATLQVGRSLQNKNPSQNDLAVIDRLVPAYGEMAQRDNVLNEVIKELGLPMSAADVRARLHIVAVPRTQLIDIHVVDANPELAAMIANEIARQVVLQSPEATNDDATSQFIQSQLVDLQVKISDAQARSTALQEQILTLTNAAEVFDAQERLAVINAQIDTWQQTYATLLQRVEPSNANVIQVVSDASGTAVTVPVQTTAYYGLGIVSGAGLGTLLALSLSLIQRSIRKPDDLGVVTGDIPIVSVPRYHGGRDGSLIMLSSPDAAPASTYRILRNTIQTRKPGEGKTTLAVTSSRIGEGKTTTAANLGVALANSGLFVILVDANLRNPELDHRFGVFSHVGFSDLLLGSCTVQSALQPTEHANVWVVGAGTVPPNYTDLLSSNRLGSLVERLSSEADVVIFDTPAIMEEQESQLLARHVDGVLLIVESGREASEEVRATIEVLQQVDAQVLTIVLNKTRESRLQTSNLPWTREARIRSRAERNRMRRLQGIHIDGPDRDARQTEHPADDD